MRLFLYLLRQLLVAFGFAMGGMFFVALPGIAVAAVHKLPNTDTAILLGYLPLVLQNLAPYVLPISFLLAVVATYGRLAADNEWTAIQMAGVRPLRMLFPAFFFACGLSALTYHLVSSELPNMKRREKEFLLDAAQTSIMNLSPGVTEIEFGDFFLKAAFQDGDVLRDVYIYRPGQDEDEEDVRAFADSARLMIIDEVLHVELENHQFVDPTGGLLFSGEYVSVDYPMARFIEEDDREYTSPRYRESLQLLRAIKEDDLDELARNAFVYEFHHRIAMAAAFFMFLTLGASTGLLMRRGTQLGAMAVAVGYALAYYLLSMRIGKQLARSGSVPPEVGAWATIVIGTAVGLLLLRRALKR